MTTAVTNRQVTTAQADGVVPSRRRQPALNIDPVEMMAGSLPTRRRRLAEAWAELHRAELREDWALLHAGRPPFPIEPLR